MRENVKKLIDLMKSESWQLHGYYFSKGRMYPRIQVYGHNIGLGDSVYLDLSKDETAYFVSIRDLMYKEWEDKKQKEAEEQLNKFFNENKPTST